MTSYRSPFYLQLREVIRTKIEEGEYPPCTAIPSESELAQMYGINRQTASNAIDTLVQEGLLMSVPGKGVYVLDNKMKRNLDELQGFTQTMEEDNRKPSFKIINRYVRPAGELYSDMFGINPDDEIYYVKRVCLADGEPVSLEEIFIPHYVVPKIEGIDLSLFSIYEIYRMYGIVLENAYQTLDIIRLDRNDARLLDIEDDSPVMFFQCKTYNETGRMVEFNRNYARGDKCTFEVHFGKY